MTLLGQIYNIMNIIKKLLIGLLALPTFLFSQSFNNDSILHFNRNNEVFYKEVKIGQSIIDYYKGDTIHWKVKKVNNGLDFYDNKGNLKAKHVYENSEYYINTYVHYYVWDENNKPYLISWKILYKDGKNPVKVSSNRCLGLTSKGTRCKNSRIQGKDYCRFHN